MTDNTLQRSTKFLKCTVTFEYTSHSIASRDISFNVRWFLRSERKKSILFNLLRAINIKGQ